MTPKFVIRFQAAFFHSLTEFVATSKKAISCSLILLKGTDSHFIRLVQMIYEWMMTANFILKMMTTTAATISFMFTLQATRAVSRA